MHIMGAPTGKVGQPKEEGTPMNTTAKSKIGLLGKVGAVAAAAAAVMAFTVPAANAAGTYALHAGTDYALAQTWTNGGTQGRSYAQHGRRVASTVWTLQSSRAYADDGYSTSYHAQVWFR
ncbi:hypothetical protein B5U84_02925 [Bifidobacterium bifidum]|nr:hypothetical protein BBL520_08545 [Bifidobacterium breve]KYJ84168.1 hypothetical protein APS66_08190 [Bifidobacterium bifidum]MBS5011783.1 hypothetical protein [Bifidobacterium longum]MSR96303.1 hypothetical protein [Bifidobacterium sp. WCA-178-WT-4B]QUF87012.1 hypothetical protein KDJ92_01615 [Bifidobacterium longum subsp. infantis]